MQEQTARDFICQCVNDHKNGEWYNEVNRMGISCLLEPLNDPSPYYRKDWKNNP